MSRVAVAGTSRIAADAGAQMCAAGGNAVDAALAASAVSMCTDIGIMSPAGGAFITLWHPDAGPLVFDAGARMPGLGSKRTPRGDSRWEVVFDYGGETRQQVGFGSIATPGTFAGIEAASQAFGNLSFADILAPAIRYAREGFELRGGAAEYLSYTHEAIYSWQPESCRILHHRDGRPLGAGDRVFVPGLAESLETLARDGAQALHGGELGKTIADGIQAAGGLLSLEDLRRYRVEQRAPLIVRIRDWEIATPPAPSVGGACLAAMLELLDQCPETRMNDAAVQWLVRSQHAVLEYRGRQLDGAGPALSDAIHRLLNAARDGGPDRVRASGDTIHASAVDGDGFACALTASAGYGAGAMVPGTGLWLNNSLGEVDLHTQGLKDLKPGAPLGSNMAPTIARCDDGTVIAIGSPGASRIATAVAQTLWQHIHFGRPIAEAVSFPRLHVEMLPDRRAIAYEPGLAVTQFEDLVPRPFDQPSMYFGGVHTARRGPQGELEAVGDARRGGCVAVRSQVS